MKSNSMRKCHANSLGGFSLIELLFAGALFSIFSWGMIEVLAYSLESDRLGEEMAAASLYATEGIEAVRSLRARDFNALVVDDAAGIAKESGEWQLSGDSDTDGKYQRTIAVAPVNRDGDGNISEGDGSDDPDTRRVTVTVSWDFTSSRPETVVLETFFTRW